MSAWHLRSLASSDSYDRLFPSQDTLPSGGFGNLIALSLQKAARERGNSVFLDDAFTPWADQWASLANVGKMSRRDVEVIVQDAEPRARARRAPATARGRGRIPVDGSAVPTSSGRADGG